MKWDAFCALKRSVKMEECVWMLIVLTPVNARLGMLKKTALEISIGVKGMFIVKMELLAWMGLLISRVLAN